MYAFFVSGKRLSDYTPVSNYQQAFNRAIKIACIIGTWVEVRRIGK